MKTVTETIVCRACLVEKEAEKFRVQSREKTGRDTLCNECRTLHRRANGEILKEAVRRHAKRAGQRVPYVKVDDLIDIFEAYPDCPYCGVVLSNDNRSIDHVYPLSVTGKHVSINCVTCCVSCNASKHNSNIYDFYQRSEKFNDKLWRLFVQKWISRMIKREISEHEVAQMTINLRDESKEINAWLAKKKGEENVG